MDGFSRLAVTKWYTGYWKRGGNFGDTMVKDIGVLMGRRVGFELDLAALAVCRRDCEEFKYSRLQRVPPRIAL
ncbi:hypothetical protein HWI79_2744 [Cryptosporidium felis]|nr:hypothetical protein HWI79_2744 [Cryptosporidium felis]